MAGPIEILPEELARQIAAGEVIERPASIVKELVENALDAGATDIRIDLAGGGCRLIRVADNGEGMAPGEIPLAFARYATSKVRCLEDIFAVRSLGFRGEALPSIAAVSLVEVRSRRPADVAGARIVVSGGVVVEAGETGCPVGSVFQVNRLFENVPARRKFLRNEATERRHCLETVLRILLPHTGVRLTVTAEGRESLRLPATADLRERLGAALGRDAAGGLLPVQAARDAVCVRGYVSPPAAGRTNARQIYLYVNGRYVRDSLLQHALMTAYRRAMEPRRYPAAVLFLTVPPEEVDVNVHPAKTEVRFRNPRAVYDVFVEAVAAGLASLPLAGGEGPSPLPDRLPSGREYQSRVAEALRRYAAFPRRRPPEDQASVFGGGAGLPHAHKRESLPAPLETRVGETAGEGEGVLFSGLAYLGQVDGTYLVFAAADGLLILDQHAAHERVLFEELRRAAERRQAPVQALLLDCIVSLGEQGRGAAEELLPLLAETGLVAEPFGPEAFRITAVPARLAGTDPAELLRDMVEAWGETPSLLPLEDKRERLCTRLACRGAVKAGQSLSPEEVAALCRDLDSLSSRQTCPHGRPLYAHLPLSALERMFRRR